MVASSAMWFLHASRRKANRYTFLGASALRSATERVRTTDAVVGGLHLEVARASRALVR